LQELSYVILKSNYKLRCVTVVHVISKTLQEHLTTKKAQQQFISKTHSSRYEAFMAVKGS